MSVHEKIKRVRQANGWTQEYLAEKLEMSVNGYGDIERGDSDIKISKLERIAELLGVELAELFDTNEKNVFYLSGTKNNQSHWSVGVLSQESLILKHELEKQQLINAQQNKEIELLKEVIMLMKKDAV